MVLTKHLVKGVGRSYPLPYPCRSRMGLDTQSRGDGRCSGQRGLFPRGGAWLLPEPYPGRLGSAPGGFISKPPQKNSHIRATASVGVISIHFRRVRPRR